VYFKAGARAYAGAAVASVSAENVHSVPFAAAFAVSTRTYIVLAALTGLVILVAFALQVLLVNK
jgi:hypothetical protein